MRTLSQLARAKRAASAAELADALTLPAMAERRITAAHLRTIRRLAGASAMGLPEPAPSADGEGAESAAPVGAPAAYTIPSYTLVPRAPMKGTLTPSLSERGRQIRARLEREEEADSGRLSPAAARFSRVYPSLRAIAAPVMYEGGTRVGAVPPPHPAASPGAEPAVAPTAEPAASPATESQRAQGRRAAEPQNADAIAPATAHAGQERAPAAEPSASTTAPALIPAAAAPAAAAFTPREESPSPAVRQKSAAALPPDAAPAPAGTVGASAKSESAEEAEPRRRRRWPWLAAAAALAAAGYTGAAAATADTVPEGTAVAGVDIGGLSSAEASAHLNSALEEKTNRTLNVALAGAEHSLTVDVSDYELGLDAQATVDAVTGFSLAPSSVAAHLFGGGEIEPVATYDEAKLGEVIQSLQSELDGGYVDATIAFDESGTPSVVPSSPGLGVDAQVAEHALTVGAFGESDFLELATSPCDPQISDEEAREALEQYAKPLAAGPLTIHFEGEDIEAPVAALAEAASFPPVDGKPVLELDGARLAQVVIDTEPEGIVFGEDAKITIVDHERVEITPSTEGIGIDEERLAADVAEAIHTPEREVTAVSAVMPARFTTDDAESMGITEIVADIDTPITWEYVRTLNLEVGAAKTSGTLVKPGETFSLLESLGPIDEAHGFYAAGMIIGGQHKDGVGGGLSQISTNTFNLGFRAGYEDIEHHPHSYYFDRYPMGAESTLAVPTLDMKWRNNTPYGAVIDTWVADGYVHSRLWSTKYWDVGIQTSEPRNVIASGWRTEVSYTCEYVPRGNNGFTVTVTRTVTREGEKPVRESNDVSYQPDYGTQCVRPTPKATQAPASSAPAPEQAPAEPAPAEQAPADAPAEAPAE